MTTVAALLAVLILVVILDGYATRDAIRDLLETRDDSDKEDS